MKKVREYRQRARECREFGVKAAGSDLRGHYERMAEVWDKLAEERLTFFVEDPATDNDNAVAKPILSRAAIGRL
ncbi:MAG TPA: hypothetical protein VHW69_01070 [Rhizomicrobium sp.]|nr:hypothetical protein [Rhizomicrobium sp.]